MNTIASFDFGEVYHVYNRTNNKEKLFKTDRNRPYFLYLLKSKLSSVADFYAYSLLENHFHLLIKIKSEEEIRINLEKIPKSRRRIIVSQFLEAEDKGNMIHQLVSSCFSGVFNSYTQAINKFYGRTGNLFTRSYKRSVVTSEWKFDYLMNYVHKNRMKHGLIKTYLNDRWSSYKEIVQENSSIINIEEIFRIYGGKHQFQKFLRNYDMAYVEKGNIISS